MSDEESSFLNVKRILKHSTPVLSKFSQSLPSLEEEPELECLESRTVGIRLFPSIPQSPHECTEGKQADSSVEMVCTTNVRRQTTLWASEDSSDELNRSLMQRTCTTEINGPSSVSRKQSPCELLFAKHQKKKSAKASQDFKTLKISDEESSFLTVKRITKHSTSVFSTFSQSLPSLEEEPEVQIPEAANPPFLSIPQYSQTFEECTEEKIADTSAQMICATNGRGQTTIWSSEDSTDEFSRKRMPRISTSELEGPLPVRKKPSTRHLRPKCRRPNLKLPGIADVTENRRRKTKLQKDWQKEIHIWEQRQLKNIEEATTYELEIEEV